MNKAAVLKILEEIKSKANKNLKVKMHYKDGTTETIDFLAAIGRYTNPGTPPEVKHIDFIGNYKNQGILPAMLLYLADIEVNTDDIAIDTSDLDFTEDFEVFTSDSDTDII